MLCRLVERILTSVVVKNLTALAALTLVEIYKIYMLTSHGVNKNSIFSLTVEWSSLQQSIWVVSSKWKQWTAFCSSICSSVNMDLPVSHDEKGWAGKKIFSTLVCCKQLKWEKEKIVIVCLVKVRESYF